MDNATLQQRIEALPYWYHKIDLGNGITTPGWAPMNTDFYRIPQDLTGKRVLDIGAWDGFWSFEALKRGAAEVVAIDDFSDYLGLLEQQDRRAWENFDLCREALGYSEKQCQRIDMSVYDITPENLGQFDVVFFFGTLYHLRYPLLALDKISALCTESLYVESAISDDYSPYQGGIGNGYPGQQMVMEFYPGNQYGENHSNWWAPSLYCMMGLVNAAGFDDIQGWNLTENPENLATCRGFVSGTKQS